MLVEVVCVCVCCCCCCCVSVFSYLFTIIINLLQLFYAMLHLLFQLKFQFWIFTTCWEISESHTDEPILCSDLVPYICDPPNFSMEYVIF